MTLILGLGRRRERAASESTDAASVMTRSEARDRAGETEVAAVRSHPDVERSAAPRVASIDALRGFTMFWIIGGDGLALALGTMLAGQAPILAYAGELIARQFQHADWDGLRFYDVIFPMFIFVTGVTIPFSLSRLVEREGKFAAHRRVLRRFLLLYALGLIYYGGVGQSFADIRFLGVLQRIALCSLFASLLFLNVGVRGMLVALAALLVGYWAVMTFVPVPGFGTTTFAPGANLADYIDAQILPGRKWNGETDPEGVLSTLPAIGTCLIGVLAGLLLKESRLNPPQKAAALIGLGVAMLLIGLGWSLHFPIIKNLWTSSFVLVTGGLSALLLAAFYCVMDVWKHRTWATVFIWVGGSAITLYFINGIVGFKALAQRLVGGDVGRFANVHFAPAAGDFLACAVGLMLAVALAAFLYRREIFLRV